MGFLADTTLRSEGDGRFSGALMPDWDIGGNANGGFLLAIAARAMAAHSGRPDPVTVTAHYLSPGKVGDIQVDVDTRKQGKLFTTMSATMTGSKQILQVVGAFSDLSDSRSEVKRVEAAPPDLPAPEDCIDHTSGERVPRFFRKLKCFLHPDDAGWSKGEPSGEMKVRGWFGLADGEALDTIGLLLAVDAFPPTVFNAKLPLGWVPTVELTAHVRARPAPGLLRGIFTTRFVTGGFLEEDGEIWDSTGTLVAQSRQLALIPLES